MDTILEVSLWGNKVGVLAWDKAAELGVFEFYDTFPDYGWDVAPLIMPLEEIRRGERIFSFPGNRGKTFRGLPGLLADALPDNYGNAVIDEYFASLGTDPVEVTPVDRLCYVGSRAMGALEFQPARDVPALSESSRIEIDHLTTLAGEILNEREQFRASLKNNDPSAMDILKVGSSAGGAKPKAVIAWNETTGEVRSGQVGAPDGFTYWLLKFDGVGDKKLQDNPLGIGKIEYAYYCMAIGCGIRMSECRLMHDGKYAHFMTRRFDRRGDGTKRHMQSLCALAHFDRDGRYSYEQAFRVMRQLHCSVPEMEEFYRRMVFNILARNHDDHTRNHTFLMDDTGRWELAPAYDLLFAYSPSGRWTHQHQLSVNNKRDEFTRADLMAVADQAGVRKAPEMIDQISEVVSRWPVYARQAGVRKEHIRYIGERLRAGKV